MYYSQKTEKRRSKILGLLISFLNEILNVRERGSNNVFYQKKLDDSVNVKLIYVRFDKVAYYIHMFLYCGI